MIRRPSRDELPHLWEDDGSLRDVYVHDATPADWRAWHALAQQHPHEYSRDGVAAPLPNPEAVFADRVSSHRLTVSIEGSAIHCHYFTASEIELDISPREVLSAATHDAVLCFIEALAQATHKPVSITEENLPERVLLRFDPEALAWEMGPSNDGAHPSRSPFATGTRSS